MHGQLCPALSAEVTSGRKEELRRKSLGHIWLLGTRAEETGCFLFGEVRTIQGSAVTSSGTSQGHSKPGPCLPLSKEGIYDISACAREVRSFFFPGRRRRLDSGLQISS